MNSKPINKYVRAVKKELFCSLEKKREIVVSLRQAINDSFDSDTDLKYEQLVDFFGTPKAQAEEYMSALDADEIKKAVRKKRIIIFVVTLITVAFIAGMTYLVIDGHIGNHGHMVTYIEDVPEEIQNDIPEGAIITDLEGF